MRWQMYSNENNVPRIFSMEVNLWSYLGQVIDEQLKYKNQLFSLMSQKHQHGLPDQRRIVGHADLPNTLPVWDWTVGMCY